MEFFGGWLLPLIYASGCLLVFGQSRHHWKIARLTAAAALLATVLCALGAWVWLQFAPLAVDSVGLTVALLVAVLGWVIINYSSRYLNGEPDQLRFVRAMLFTLAAVGILVVSRHLLVIVLPGPAPAWVCTTCSHSTGNARRPRSLHTKSSW